MKKKCGQCNLEKPVSEFSKHINHGNKDGLYTYCKSCQSDNYKVWYRKNRERNIQKATQWGRDNKERKDANRKRWNDANPEKVKEMSKRTAEKQMIKFPEKKAARRAVMVAVRQGVLPNIKQLACKECGGRAKSYHHFLGYSKEHWLDVIPLCYKCHYLVDHQS